MAIDSAAKRASSAGDWLEQHVIPDGTLDQADRQTIAGDYGGILAEAVTLLLECFVNLKAVVRADINILQAVQNSASIRNTISPDVNLKNALTSAINVKSEVC